MVRPITSPGAPDACADPPRQPPAGSHGSRRRRPWRPAPAPSAAAAPYGGGRSPPALQLAGRTAGLEQRAHITAPRPDDERLQLQLPLLPHAAGSRDAADAAQAGGAGARVSGRAAPRLVRGAVRYHGDPGASGERDGRPDPGARAAAVAAWVPRLHPRQGPPRG